MIVLLYYESTIAVIVLVPSFLIFFFFFFQAEDGIRDGRVTGVQTCALPIFTDEGHIILDCHFGEIPDPRALARQLDSLTGIVEHGLFVDMATLALIGKGGDVLEFRRDPR